MNRIVFPIIQPVVMNIQKCFVLTLRVNSVFLRANMTAEPTTTWIRHWLSDMVLVLSKFFPPPRHAGVFVLWDLVLAVAV